MSNNSNLEYILYKATSPTGLSYIGVTKFTIDKRRKQHEYASRRGSPYPLHRAIAKYGSKIVWSIEAIVTGQDKAFELEIALIKLHNSLINGYNLTIGGDGVVGRRVTREQKIKLSKIHKGKTPHINSLNAMRENAIGQKNWKFAGRIFTPFGIFESYSDAVNVLKLPRSTISQRCHSKSETWKSWYLERSSNEKTK